MNEDQKMLAASRPRGVAAELGATELDAAAVYAKRVILIGEPDFLATRNGELCFLDSLRLLARIVGNLEVVVPAGLGKLQQEVDQLVDSLWSPGTVQSIKSDQVVFDGAASILNVGLRVQGELPWTSISASGWVARCTSGSNSLPQGSDQVNPISCMLAASLGVTEVFKRIYAVPIDKAAPIQDAAFSLFNLSDEFADDGPPLPSQIDLPESLFLGGGAIGNGIALLLSQLPVTGRALILDKQVFAIENHGTCTLLDSASWIGKSKAETLATWLKNSSGLEVDGLMATIEDAMANVLSGNTIDLVVNGLDDVGARRAVQKLWPSLIVDGAINSAGASVVMHRANQSKFACLRCTFAEPNEDHVSHQVNSTGLHSSSLQGDQNRLITDQDIYIADPSKQAWLRDQQNRGKTICSTISDGIAQTLGLSLATEFRPSVPFVATASAALVIAQVLRNLFWPEERYIHEFQFASLFVGVDTATKVGRHAANDCDCTKNRQIIEAILGRRKAAHTVR